MKIIIMIKRVLRLRLVPFPLKTKEEEETGGLDRLSL
jgi:hypothetical protein